MNCIHFNVFQVCFLPQAVPNCLNLNVEDEWILFIIYYVWLDSFVVWTFFGKYVNNWVYVTQFFLRRYLKAGVITVRWLNGQTLPNIKERFTIVPGQHSGLFMNSMTCDGEDKATSAVIGCCPCSIRVQTHVRWYYGAPFWKYLGDNLGLRKLIPWKNN